MSGFGSGSLGRGITRLKLGGNLKTKFHQECDVGAEERILSVIRTHLGRQSGFACPTICCGLETPTGRMRLALYLDTPVLKCRKDTQLVRVDYVLNNSSGFSSQLELHEEHSHILLCEMAAVLPENGNHDINLSLIPPPNNSCPSSKSNLLRYVSTALARAGHVMFRSVCNGIGREYKILTNEVIEQRQSLRIGTQTNSERIQSSNSEFTGFHLLLKPYYELEFVAVFVPFKILVHMQIRDYDVSVLLEAFQGCIIEIMRFRLIGSPLL